MKMEKILAASLKALETGEMTIREILARHLEHQEDLTPLLEKVVLIRAMSIQTSIPSKLMRETPVLMMIAVGLDLAPFHLWRGRHI